jgi:hypothetical protein
MTQYGTHYELQQAFQAEPGLIPRVELYNFDPEKVYAAMMERLAQPLPSGEPSPFSARNPGSAHSMLISAIVYLQGLAMHEINLSPDSTYLDLLRLQGADIRGSEPAIVNLEFSRTPEAIRQGIVVEIPAGIEIRSRFRPGVSCVLMDNITINNTASGIAPARLNQAGAINAIRDNEFSLLPSNMSFIESVKTVEVVSFGRLPESIYEAAVRARELHRTGDRGVTDLDFQRRCIALGAQKVNVIRGYSPSFDGYFRDLRTIAVYPNGLAGAIQADLMEFKLADERVDVVDAEVIRVDGNVNVRALGNLQDLEVFNLVASAIRERINPPQGIWGDREFKRHLAEALERAVGIYAVPEVELLHIENQSPVDFTKLRPWQLVQVQQSLNVTILRG